MIALNFFTAPLPLFRRPCLLTPQLEAFTEQFLILCSRRSFLRRLDNGFWFIYNVSVLVTYDCCSNRHTLLRVLPEQNKVNENDRRLLLKVKRGRQDLLRFKLELFFQGSCNFTLNIFFTDAPIPALSQSVSYSESTLIARNGKNKFSTAIGELG